MGSMGAWAELDHLGGQESMVPVAHMIVHPLDDGRMSRDQAEALAAVSARALARLDKIDERYGLDRIDGSVITFTRAIRSRAYSYAAIRTGGFWYLTGSRSPQHLTWTELTDWLDREGIQEITALVEAPAVLEDDEGDYPARGR